MLRSLSRFRADQFLGPQAISGGRTYSAIAGAIAAGAPFLLLIRDMTSSRGLGDWLGVSGAVVAALPLACGGFIMLVRPLLGRLLATVGVILAVAAHIELIAASPAILLTATLSSTLVLIGIWTETSHVRHRSLLHLHPDIMLSRTRGACGAALVGWLTVVLARQALTPLVVAASASSFLIAIYFAVVWLIRMRRFRPIPLAWIAAVMGLILGAAVSSLPHPELALSVAALFPLAALGFTVAAGPTLASSRLAGSAWWDTILYQPARLLVVTFLGLCLAGTLLLSLPVSSAGAAGISVVDAAFTAVSAVCVTGLIVLDTPTDFTLFGQASILLLIQCGALGIMTFSTAALGVLGRRLSLRYEGVLSSVLSVSGGNELFRALRLLLTFTFCAEAAGTVVLSGFFLAAGDTPLEALWRGLFTSVSAFCNAGFALQGDSLIGYQHNPWILHTVGLLIVLGGLSPAVVVSAPVLLRRGRVPLQAKLALILSAVLLVTGAVAFTAIEWNNSLAQLSFIDRIHNGWFQSVTLRTAGFNSVDLEDIQTPAITLMIVWMFIGGSPGGTAGGIKTTTVAVLGLAVLAAVRGRWEVIAFRRRVPTETVYKAAAIATSGLLSGLAALVALQLTQALDGADLIFEAASALGTVGLSLGGTPLLDEVGKIIIMATMFAGRLGPLTLFLFLSDRHAASSWTYPDEGVDVG